MLAVQYLFIICMAFGAACSSDNGKSENATDSIPENTPDTTERKLQRIPETAQKEALVSPQEADTLYRISGTEPFWSLVIAKPEIRFTSMEGDTLTFPYQEPLKAAGRPADYVQVYDLGGQQHLILKKETQCPCSDGMSDIEYPYQATLILSDRVLEGCGRNASTRPGK